MQRLDEDAVERRFYLKDKWNTLSVKKGLDPILEKYYVDPLKDWNIIKNRLFEYKNILFKI